MKNLNKHLGKIIAESRKKAGMTQESLAFECDLHPTYISQIERGIKSPTMGTFFKIAEALGEKPSKIVQLVEK